MPPQSRRSTQRSEHPHAQELCRVSRGSRSKTQDPRHLCAMSRHTNCKTRESSIGSAASGLRRVPRSAHLQAKSCELHRVPRSNSSHVGDLEIRTSCQLPELPQRSFRQFASHGLPHVPPGATGPRPRKMHHVSRATQGQDGGQALHQLSPTGFRSALRRKGGPTPCLRILPCDSRCTSSRHALWELSRQTGRSCGQGCAPAAQVVQIVSFAASVRH